MNILDNCNNQNTHGILQNFLNGEVRCELINKKKKKNPLNVNLLLISGIRKMSVALWEQLREAKICKAIIRQKSLETRML